MDKAIRARWFVDKRITIASWEAWFKNLFLLLWLFLLLLYGHR
jgi:hypothetical protein